MLMGPDILEVYVVKPINTKLFSKHDVFVNVHVLYCRLNVGNSCLLHFQRLQLIFSLSELGCHTNLLQDLVVSHYLWQNELTIQFPRRVRLSMIATAG